ncbi:acyl-ACP family thioesterase [Lactobacillus pasteurii DSM 23907 = CRBIP 24.76]|uniref:Acyl-ACP family thioesterase n=1 Tax=Lactobacillus pasteurii DSM 23907 = CRBIP 24.76 TaxID=1423790 RepID=I7LB43_9LACO|nr:acyl-ACP thioesterase domain-containing protein [Lactobacillus pasteurii]KRK08112.1 acyl-ACP family thioesterase [Lactobacillus pasteurii DSM 23907 = CRBIP 24.76]TDG76064.1 hypothetical protein C5L33_001622 [Lactobacillus pasteurii]CCI85236.1 Acyl-ACP family thioesterase [Lactobacillus pasteurii DSM 23907 = CRBIP 24.76]
MKYTEEHTIEYGECDENQHLKLTSMMDLLMQVSEHQLDEHNIGTNDLLDQGLGWVVTQYHMQITRLPKPAEKVILTTTASGYNRFLSYRDFSIEDKAGNALVSVHSQWVLFNLKERKLVPSDEKIMEKIDAPKLKKMPRFPRIRPLESYEQKKQYSVAYYDLDTNHHLTNSHYFNWLIDVLGREFMSKHRICEIDLKFDQEFQYGEEPYSCVSYDRVDQTTLTHHALMDETGSKRAVCEMKWQNK